MQEGGVHGITTVVKRFRLQPSKDHRRQSISLDGTTDKAATNTAHQHVLQEHESLTLVFGTEEMSELPDFLKNLPSLLYRLLAHQQQTVREHATKAFISFLSRSDFAVIEKSFQALLEKLASNSNTNHMLGAYEAEGFLNVAAILVNELPVAYVLAHWENHFPVFERYLAHRASSVRQV
jgi:hypothetical protein